MPSFIGMPAAPVPYPQKKPEALSGHLHQKTKKAKILIITKDFGFLILLRFYLLCFLLKTAVAIPLKKSRKRKINVFLRGNCFGKNKTSSGCMFLWIFYQDNSARSLENSLPLATENCRSRSSTVSFFFSSPRISRIICPLFIIIRRLP